MAWDKESVLKELQKSYDLKQLANEYKGRYMLLVTIEGNTILLSNSVGGISEAYLLTPLNYDTLPDVSEFASIAQDILTEMIKKS